MANLGQRAILLAQGADLWIDLGDLDRAKLGIAEAQAIATSLPSATLGARVACALIEPLARIEPKLARKRLDEMIDPTDSDQCRLTLALRSARSDPAGAVRTFGQIRDSKLRLRATPELAYRLAPIDLSLARSVANSVQVAHPSESAYALGMISAGLIPTDRVTALTVLQDAFARLEAVARSDPRPKSDDGVDPSLAAATLLPVAHAIDPRLVPEFLWKTLELYPLRLVPDPRSDALIALLVDRYDRTAAARLLFNPTRISRLLVPPTDLPLVLLVGLQVNPALILQWIRTPLEINGSATNLIDQYSLDLIAAWTLSDLDRWRLITHDHLNLWTP